MGGGEAGGKTYHVFRLFDEEGYEPGTISAVDLALQETHDECRIVGVARVISVGGGAMVGR